MQEFKDDEITYYSILRSLPTDTSELGKVWGLKEVKEAVRVGPDHLISPNNFLTPKALTNPEIFLTFTTE